MYCYYCSSISSIILLVSVASIHLLKLVLSCINHSFFVAAFNLYVVLFIFTAGNTFLFYQDSQMFEVNESSQADKQTLHRSCA